MTLGDLTTMILAAVAAVAGSLALLMLQQILKRVGSLERTIRGGNGEGEGVVTKLATLRLQVKEHERRLNYWRPYRKGDPEGDTPQ